MSVDWRFLGEAVILQSTPRLAKKYGLQIDLPEERMLYGTSPKQFLTIIEKYEAVLRKLFHEFRVSWKEIYSNSDIGKERLAVARRMEIKENDAVLDIGCGRGYSSAALAMHSRFVVSLDLMNGLGRKGWWQKFKLTMRELTLRDRIFGVKGNAALMPFNGTFSAVVSVHGIRNFPDKATLQQALKEMKRVTRKGGRVIVVESLPVAVTKAQEAHLKMFNCKVKYSSGDMSFFAEKELINFFENADLKEYHTKTIDFNLSAAPPFFFLNILNLPEEKRARAEKEYSEAVQAVKKWGETSTPAFFVEALVE